MKIIFVFLFCLSAAAGVFARSERNGSTPNEVEEISLARDDGSGKPGEFTTVFAATDVPIHCLVQLSSTDYVTVKMNLAVVKAAGLRPGASIVIAEYKTNGKQDRVLFQASPESANWLAGTYRVDISLNGKFARSLEFEIKKSPSETARGKQTTPKLAPTRLKKPRTPRKN